MYLSNYVLVSSILYLLLVGTLTVATFLVCMDIRREMRKINNLLSSNFSYFEGETGRETQPSAFDTRIEKMKEELANYTAEARAVHVQYVEEREAPVLHSGVYNIPHDENDKRVARIIEEAEEYAE